MGLEAGKFFIDLGLTGAEKTASGLAQISDHFEGLKGITTEAKLAILAALAGLEEMTSHSGQFAANMQLAATATGASMHALQLWNNVFQMTTGQADQGQAVLQRIHDIFFNLQKGQVPDWLNYLFTNLHEKITPKDMDKWKAHPESMMPTLMKMSQLSQFSKANLTSMLQAAGFPAGAVESMVKGIPASVMSKAAGPILSDATLGRLSNDFATFQHATQEFDTAMHLFVDNPIIKELLNGLDSLGQKLDDFMKQQLPMDAGGVLRAFGLTSGRPLPDRPGYYQGNPTVAKDIGDFMKTHEWARDFAHYMGTSAHQRLVEQTTQKVELTLNLKGDPSTWPKQVKAVIDLHGKKKREHAGSSSSSASGGQGN